MKICPNCKTLHNDINDFYCLKCNHRLVNCDDFQDSQPQPETPPETINVPRCPTCHSTNIEKVSDSKKLFGAVMFGIFSTAARSQFCCKNCGYKW